jgi:hypothetical protein
VSISQLHQITPKLLWTKSNYSQKLFAKYLPGYSTDFSFSKGGAFKVNTREMFFTLDGVVIESGGRLDGDGGGYSAAKGPGAGSGSKGGSYASLGGSAATRKYYGSLYRPRYPGSGGGGTAGGSWINVTAGGYVKVDGTLRVNGASGYGAGSGGSLTITTSLLIGYGQLSSHGGELE